MILDNQITKQSDNETIKYTMTALAELDMNFKLFLDRSTVLYGESGSGKSFAIADILYTIKPHIDQIIVVCPTDPINRAYSGNSEQGNGLVPLACIHHQITEELLENIWKRQEAFAAVYARANNIIILESLYAKVARYAPKEDAQIAIIRKTKASREAEIKQKLPPDAATAKIKALNEDFTKLIIKCYKQVINLNMTKLRDMTLSEDEKFSLKFLNFNPRLVLIFDDCTDQLKQFKAHPVIQKLFYQGRWAFITTIIACHTDKSLDPELKKNSFVNIFTESGCCHAYIERPSNDLTREQIKSAQEAVKQTFVPIPELKNQKLVWIREQKKFFKYTADSHPNFTFGAPILRSFCNRVTNTGTSATDNKFMAGFKT